MCLNLQAYEEDSVSHGQNTREQEKEMHPCYTGQLIRLNLNLLLLDWTLVIYYCCTLIFWLATVSLALWLCVQCSYKYIFTLLF